MEETQRRPGADPLSDPAAAEALVETLTRYLPPTKAREQRKERLRRLVAALEAKGCATAEMVRILREKGVRTSFRTVRRLRTKGAVPATGAPVADGASPPLTTPPGESGLKGPRL